MPTHGPLHRLADRQAALHALPKDKRRGTTQGKRWNRPNGAWNRGLKAKTKGAISRANIQTSPISPLDAENTAETHLQPQDAPPVVVKRVYRDTYLERYPAVPSRITASDLASRKPAPQVSIDAALTALREHWHDKR